MFGAKVVELAKPVLYIIFVAIFLQGISNSDIKA